MAQVRIEKAIVKGVSSPDTIQRIAQDKGINAQEVFVRLTFMTEGQEFTASNKLRFLGKKGYEQLMKAKDSEETVDITVDTEKEFFYINSGITVDDLFKTELPKKERPSLKNLLTAQLKATEKTATAEEVTNEN